MNAIMAVAASITGFFKSVWIYWLLMGTHITPLCVSYDTMRKQYIVGVHADSLSMMALNGVHQNHSYADMRASRSPIASVNKYMTPFRGDHSPYASPEYGERNFKAQPVLSRLLQNNRIRFTDYIDGRLVNTGTIMSLIDMRSDTGIAFGIGD